MNMVLGSVVAILLLIAGVVYFSQIEVNRLDAACEAMGGVTVVAPHRNPSRACVLELKK